MNLAQGKYVEDDAVHHTNVTGDLASYNISYDTRNPMNFGLAFHKTLKKYGLKGKEVAEAADVSPGMVSRFRGGSAINTDSLEKLLAVLEAKPRKYFLEHVIAVEDMHTALQNSVSTAELVEHLSDREIATLLYALASKVKGDIL